MKTYDEFVQLVIEMRHAQKDYFQFRKSNDLKRARDLEKKVDLECLYFTNEFSQPRLV